MPADSTTLFVKKNEFLSITDPTQPIVLQDATVNLQSALMADETGNFINVIFSPLTLWEISGTSIGMPRADYHITATSAALNTGSGTPGATTCPARTTTARTARRRSTSVRMRSSRRRRRPTWRSRMNGDGRTTVARGTDNGDLHDRRDEQRRRAR